MQDILQGREKGAERLVAEYKDSLYAAALALCGNPATAEDLVSQTFEKVVLKIDTCRDSDSFYGWMYAILLNCYRNSIRNKVSGTAEQPRLCVCRTGAHIYCQVIDDEAGVTESCSIYINPVLLKEVIHYE